MKILYTIFTTSHGNGGHFYSLATTAKALSSKAEVVIVNFGFQRSPVIEKSGLTHYNILLKNARLTKPYKKFKELIREENPHVIHSFCTLSFFFVRIYALFHPVKKILTKCGGPNPKKYFPFSNELILYSKENYDFFRKIKKFKSANLYIIANRILEQPSDNGRISELKKMLGAYHNSKVFLRIGRISNHYKNSILQTVRLINDLNLKGYNSILLLIGTIQNRSVFEEVSNLAQDHVLCLTDVKFTANASTLIDVADFVIGTGRSLMEAASKSKILLTPNINSKYPILVTEDNFQSLLDTNFSPRNSILSKDEEILSNISELFCNSLTTKYLKDISFVLFKEYFDISEKLDYYLTIYSRITSHRNNLSFDLIIHMAIVKIYAAKQKSK